MTLFDNSAVYAGDVIKILDKMKEGIGEGWSGVFEGADAILYNIAEELCRRLDKEIICPSSADVFRAFRECKYSAMKVVWVLQDPYHQVINGTRVADGIAMSCRNTRLLQPSLRLVYDEIERTVNDLNRTGVKEPDLTRWANQGILMLNTALTVARGKPGSHTELWKSFTRYLLKRIDASDVIFVFSGNHASSYSNSVTKGHKLFTIHPAAASYLGTHWNSGDLFNNINDKLRDKILW